MKKLLLLLLIISLHVHAQQFHWENVTPKTDASFRGLSVVDDDVVWVSGSKGRIGKSTNGGKDWTYSQVKGYEKCDFRSVYAFNAGTAVIANAGTPAYILYTKDGGSSWEMVYENADTAAFFDGIDFRNDKEGIIYGDPIGGRMLILETSDGGYHWKELLPEQRPLLMKGEASFAASGTAIRCLPNNTLLIATGGKQSSLWVSRGNAIRWKSFPTPILQGIESTGIFSVAAMGTNTIIVGGDYKRDTLGKNHIFISNNDLKTWIAPKAPTRGYRECVEYIDRNTVISTGPTGTDISYDGGMKWEPFSDEQQFHVVRKARKGKLIIAAGGAGKIALIR